MQNPTESPKEETSLFASFPPTPTSAWESQIKEDLKEDDYEKTLFWRPPDGFTVKAYYRAGDLEDAAHLEADRPYRSTGRWQIRQDIHASDVGEANRKARRALQLGAGSIGFVLSDRDDAAGLFLHRRQEMQRLLERIPLTSCPLHFRGKAASLSALALLLDEVQRQDLPHDALRGTIDYDPVSARVQSGQLEGPLASEETAALVQKARSALPHVRLITLDAAPYHEAGASAVQELAFSMAALSEYLASLAEAGCPAATTCRSTHLRLPVGPSYLKEIAKLRAARLLFPQVGNAYASSPVLKGSDAYLQAVTSHHSYTPEDPHQNLLRGTTEAMAGLLGGADTLTVQPFTSPAPPDDFAVRLARNTQLILQEEAYLGKVIDPAGGAYYIELLTDRMARSAWSLFQQVETQGGLLEAYRTGFIQQQLDDARESVSSTPPL